MQHRNLAPDQIHQPFHWIVDDAPGRLALVTFPAEAGSLCWQKDTDVVWCLRDDRGWFEVGAGAGGGATGKSAYEVAVDNGFVGTEAQWLDSLVGPQGIQGDTGAPGTSLLITDPQTRIVSYIDGDYSSFTNLKAALDWSKTAIFGGSRDNVGTLELQLHAAGANVGCIDLWHPDAPKVHIVGEDPHYGVVSQLVSIVDAFETGDYTITLTGSFGGVTENMVLSVDAGDSTTPEALFLRGVFEVVNVAEDGITITLRYRGSPGSVELLGLVGGTAINGTSIAFPTWVTADASDRMGVFYNVSGGPSVSVKNVAVMLTGGDPTRICGVLLANGSALSLTNFVCSGGQMGARVESGVLELDGMITFFNSEYRGIQVLADGYVCRSRILTNEPETLRLSLIKVGGTAIEVERGTFSFSNVTPYIAFGRGALDVHFGGYVIEFPVNSVLMSSFSNADPIVPAAPNALSADGSYIDAVF